MGKTTSQFIESYTIKIVLVVNGTESNGLETWVYLCCVSSLPRVVDLHSIPLACHTKQVLTHYPTPTLLAVLC